MSGQTRGWRAHSYACEAENHFASFSSDSTFLITHTHQHTHKHTCVVMVPVHNEAWTCAGHLPSPADRWCDPGAAIALAPFYSSLFLTLCCPSLTASYTVGLINKLLTSFICLLNSWTFVWMIMWDILSINIYIIHIYNDNLYHYGTHGWSDGGIRKSEFIVSPYRRLKIYLLELCLF